MEASPTFRHSSGQRSEFLTELRARRSEISLLLDELRVDGSDVGALRKQLIVSLDQLISFLTAQVDRDASVVDAEGANDVLPQLLRIFNQPDRYPARLLENAIRCLRVLIQYGWKSSIHKDAAQQFLILLTLIVGGTAAGATDPNRSEETVLEGFRALNVLVRTAGRSVVPASGSGVASYLDQAMVVILDGVKRGATPEMQLEAVDCVQAVFSKLTDVKSRASLFPATVSSLTQLLSPPASLKKPRRLIIRGLLVLKDVLVTVLGDAPTVPLLTRSPPEGTTMHTDSTGPAGVSAPDWLESTASQVKPYLSRVLKLRNHQAHDVLEAVEVFCTHLLDKCGGNLSDCVPMLLESAMVASAGDGDDADTAAATTLSTLGEARNIGLDFQDLLPYTNLRNLSMVHPEFLDHIKAILYNWITGLALAMQSSDQAAKQRALRLVSKGTTLFRSLRAPSLTLEDSLGAALKDSVVTLALESKSPLLPVLAEDPLDEGGLSQNSAPMAAEKQLQRYRPVLMAQEGQAAVRNEIAALIRALGSPAQQAKLAGEMLGYAADSDGLDQIAAYWLSFELLKAAFSKNAVIDEFFDLAALAPSATDETETVFQELYAFSVSTLAAHSDGSEVDWRLEAIALEAVAFGAFRMRESFRPELIDVLYPVATFMGSPSAQLRGHAITTLNYVAAFSGYANVSDLIIDNADYMVNSVSLRLNTLDISPASTRVLAMMIRLTGPRLVPFLNDVVAALFAALDNYHGYPAFVESLFSVLSEVVSQGARSDQRLLHGPESKPAVDNRNKRAPATTTADILALLDRRAGKRKRRGDADGEVDAIAPGHHPKRPWKDSEADELLKKHEQGGEDANDEREERDERSPPPSSAEIYKGEAAKTPTYAILARIASLTQHYLTSPTPTLRKSLLDLLATVSAALAPDEAAFLPLVNSVWPVVVSRLYDDEPYVAVAACAALEALCAAAGDFLAGRIKTEWRSGLGKWCARAKSEARRAGSTRPGGTSGDGDIVLPIRLADGGATTAVGRQQQAGGGLGRFTQAAQVWQAAAAMLAAAAAHVRLDDDVFDDVLDLLADGLGRDDAAREALETVNADAVWLALYKRGQVQRRPAPVMDGVVFAPMEPAIASPNA